MARPDIDRRRGALCLFFTGGAEQHRACGHDDDRADHAARPCQAAGTGHDRSPAPEHGRRHGQSDDRQISGCVRPRWVCVGDRQRRDQGPLGRRREVSSLDELRDEVIPAVGGTTCVVRPQDVRVHDPGHRESTVRRFPVRDTDPRAWLRQPDHHRTTHRQVLRQPPLTRLVSLQQTADVVSPREQLVAHPCLRL